MNENMNHHQQLDAYLAGQMTLAEQREFEKHIQTCTTCRTELEKFASVETEVSKLPRAIKPGRDLWHEIEARLEPDTGTPGQQRDGLTRRTANILKIPLSNMYIRAAAAVLLLAAAGSIVFLLRGSKLEKREPQLGERQTLSTTVEKPTAEQPRLHPRVENETESFAQNQRSKVGQPSGSTLASGNEGGFFNFLKTSFVKFTEHLPNDRVYLQLDKPFYQPGETIWFQAYVRNEEDLLPSRQSDILHVELINPRGTIAQQFLLVANDGVASGDIDLDESLAGGIYKLKAYTNWQRNLPDPFYFEKEIQVQNVTLPRLKMNLEFERKAFGAGDKVVATFGATTLDNKPLGKHDFRYVVNIDGKKILDKIDQTDRSGMAYVSFDLPRDLSATDGLLGILIDHEGQIESISRSIPIVLNKINLTLYPEGGDLVNGIESRVAFQALNEFNKPADVEGIVVTQDGQEVTRFASFHQGMGTFTLTPQAGMSYCVKITKPVGISSTFSVPEALPKGFTLALLKISPEQVTFDLGSTENEEMYLVGQMRGQICFTKRFTARSGRTSVSIPIYNTPAGVLQATLFDTDRIERAERLVFINKNSQLKIQISTNKVKYLPREKVELTIKAADGRGVPLPANVSLAVVDDKLISFADDKSGNILAKMLLEPDLKEKVEEPNFYFNPKEPKADEALDDLMMTRGWRRFTWQQVMVENLPEIKYRPERAVIAGTVVDGITGVPIANATVTIAGTDRSMTTDDNGKFSFKYTNADSLVDLVVNKEQYGSCRIRVSELSDTLRCEIWKEGNPVRLAGKLPDQGRTSVNHGKIVGKIIDAKTGEPLVGVNVQVLGTTRGAVTDLDGKFTIIGVPTGAHSLRANLVGYQELEITNATISRDETTTLNFRLVSSEVTLPSVVITADQKLVNPSITSSSQTISANAVGKIRNVKEAQDVVKLQAGAVNQQNNLFLRDGRANEVQYLVDGLRGNNIVGNAGLAGRQVYRGNHRYYRARVFPAPIYSSEENPTVRNDFRSTIFWKGDIVLDRTGKTVVSFYNSDEVTSFRATVEGISTSGLVGRAEKTFYTQLPFSMAVKVPVEVSMGDRVSVPLTLSNNTDQEIIVVPNIRPPKSWKPLIPPGTLGQRLEAGATKTLYLPYEVLNVAGKDTFEASFESAGLRDAFQQEVVVGERGFPQVYSFSGSEKKNTYSFVLNQPVSGTVRAKLTLYPSVTSNLISGVEAMFQEPGGCFEQSSSRNYPNVIALRYLQEYDIKDAGLISRVKKFLDDGYKRLTGFETKEKGYEWFGAVPPHEALTAYGLLEFKDMEPVYASLDKAMVDRTAKWLMNRKDGRGGFLRDQKALDSFGRASPEITNAYIVYSLAEAGYTDIRTELNSAYKAAIQNEDPYQLALIANASYSLNDLEHGSELIKSLLKAQQIDGSWTGMSKSITQSSGLSLKIETTSLAILALLKAGSPQPDALTAGVKFILSSRSGYGGFGSTQGTILALKALTEYARFSQQTSESGTANVSLDGTLIASKSYAAGEREPIVVEGLEQSIPIDGKNHIVTIDLAGSKRPLPHSMLVSWNTTLPSSSESAKVSLHTRLSQPSVRMGETVRLTTTLANITSGGLPMTIAIVGIPGGLSAQPWQLKELQEKRIVDFYEIIGRHVAFYYRQLFPNEKKEINLDLKAEIPGTYESPASSAYLYYTNEYKSWSSAGNIEITEP